MLNPQRTILVEGGNTFFRWYEPRVRFVRGFLHKPDDCLSGETIAPRRQHAVRRERQARGHTAKRSKPEHCRAASYDWHDIPFRAAAAISLPATTGGDSGAIEVPRQRAWHTS
jgi:hypothetical protein